eukprot:4295716-Pyramimonas_sp.AAC.1
MHALGPANLTARKNNLLGPSGSAILPEEMSKAIGLLKKDLDAAETSGREFAFPRGAGARRGGRRKERRSTVGLKLPPRGVPSSTLTLQGDGLL